jgi:hypothetical protein
MMNKIQLRGVDSSLSQIVSDDIQYLKKHLNEILINSHQSFVENLIKETECLIEQGKDESKDYYDKHLLFGKVTEIWFDAHKHYRDTPEAIEFIKYIDHITNHSIAYYYLLLSLSLINGERTSDNESNLQGIVVGFSYLSQTTDVFTDFFSDSELHQIYNVAKNAIALSNRDVNGFFATDIEISKLETQLRAYSSLIIFGIDEHYKNMKVTLNDVKQKPENLEDDLIETIREGIYQGWTEARTGKTHPISELWEGIDVD